MVTVASVLLTSIFVNVVLNGNDILIVENMLNQILQDVRDHVRIIQESENHIFTEH
jgi:hypothetical protein